MDPFGDCISARSHGGKDDSGLLMEKDTLDLIKPSDINHRKTFRRHTKQADKLGFKEEELKLDDDKDEVDSEWERFLEEARKDPDEDFEEQPQIKRKSSKEEEKERIEYYRRLVTENIVHITEKKQDEIAPSLYSQTVNENQLISEKEIDHTSFNKNVQEILNVEIILLVLSRTNIHHYLTSDMEIARWKKFLIKYLK